MQDNETNGLVAAGKSIATCERNPTLNRIELIQDLPIFNDLSPQDCSAIVSAAHEQTFHRHGTIFSEGSPCGLVLLLLSGCAKITQLGAAGCEVMLRLSGPGELIDGLAIYTGGINFVTARATRSTKALTWDVATFESFYNRYPILRRNISRYLSLRLQELEERYCEISTEKVATRLSQQLIRLFRQLDQQVSGAVEIGLSREELAQLTGTTLFTVSRLLSQWQKMGIVSSRREAVVVRDLQALVELSEAG